MATYDPNQGRYGTCVYTAPKVPPNPPAGTLMTSAELAKCVTSDDVRFYNTGVEGSTDAYQLFRFTLPLPETIKNLTIRFEGYPEAMEGPYLPYLIILWWNADTSAWVQVYSQALEAHDYLITRWISDADIDAFVDGDGYGWLGIRTGAYAAPYIHRLHTDDVYLEADVIPTSTIAARMEAMGSVDIAYLSSPGTHVRHAGGFLNPSSPSISDLVVNTVVEAEYNPSAIVVDCRGRKRLYVTDGSNVKELVSDDGGKSWS